MSLCLIGRQWLPYGFRKGVIIGILVALSHSRAYARLEWPSELAGKPVVGCHEDGQLEVFTVGPDGVLRHRRQDPATGDWSVWMSLGGSLSPGIAVANATDGVMRVFAVDHTNGTLWCISQRATNSSTWSGWTNLGGSIRAPVAVGQNADRRLEVFALSAGSDEVMHLWQTNLKGGWSDWESLGGTNDLPLVVAQNRLGRLELFGVNRNDHALVHCWQHAPNGSARWSAWAGLGGAIAPGFAVGRNVRGLVEVFAVHPTNGSIHRRCQTSPGSSEEWRPWEDFGVKAKPGIAVGQSAAGRLELWAVGADDSRLLHRWETDTDGSDRWSQWKSADRLARPFPAVAQNEDGNLEVFAVDVADEKTIYHRRQISLASDWLDWLSLDHRTFQYASRLWQVNEGLPDNQVLALAQTRDGYLWAGTHGGLARFDGLEFTRFDSPSAPALKNSSITALCADRAGELWIGTDGAGLLRLKDDDCLQLGSTNGLAGDQVRVIYEGKDHSLWIGTTAGLSHYRDGVFKTYTTRNGLLSDVVSDVLEDRDGNLWIGTGSGLNRLRSNGAIDSFAMPNGLPNDSVRGICQDRGGRIWIGSNNGLLWYNWFWGRSFYAYNSRYGLSDSFVSAIREDLEGNMWVGTYSGLNRFHEGRFINVADNEGLPFGHIYSLLEDTDSDLWVGSRDGLVRLTPKRFTTYTRQHGLTHNNVTSVMQDREGTMWIGTWGGGLDSLKDDRITSLKGTNRTAQNLVVSPPISPGKIPAASSPNGVAEDLVLSLCEGRDGCLWVGTDFNGGLTRIKDGSVKHYTAKDGLINAGLRVLHEDRAGNLWIGTSHGLGRFTDGKFTTFMRTNGLPSDSIHAICEDQTGNVWFGTEAGLSRWTKGSFVNLTTKDGLSTNTILSLYADEQNALWIGTRGGGLNRYKDGRFSACTAQQGLFSDEIFTILEDDNRWLWMSCSRGVFRILKRSIDDLTEGKVKLITSIAYDRNDGMETAQCNDLGQPAGWKSHDGTLWFATGKGLAKVDPRTVKIDRVPPPVFISDLIADRRRVEWKSEPGNSQPFNHSQKPRDPSAPLRVPPGRGELEFHFTALNLSAVEKSRFRYKLEGIDDDWTEAGSHRVASYKNVPPGPYRFSVSACNKDGVWNEAGASLSIIYLPHLSQTWWFRALGVLAIIGVAGGAARFITRRRMQRQLAFLEQRNALERERGRIAKDIHDDLGSSLTRIMMLGERAEEGLTRREDVGGHLHKIVGSARSTVRALDEIVWAINPENDTLDGLVVYIGHYADELFEDTDIHCRLEIPIELPPLSLPAETRHNLFLVGKEAFHNVLKHSHASEVRVRIAATNSTIQMEIEDNGRGLPEPADGKGRKGNGLENMRKRMKNIGGEFELTSAPKKGVKLMFRIQFSEVSKR